MANGRSRQREQHWRAVIRDQAASGLPIAAFCRQHDITPASFYSWRRKLAGRDDQNAERDGRDAAGQDAAAKFVPVELPALPKGSPALKCSSSAGDRTGFESFEFEIVRPDGCRVRVPRQFDVDSLREILQILRLLEEFSC